MKRTFSILAVLLIFLFDSNSIAQTNAFTISGKVISFEESFALEGVSIVIKGTNKYTGTQADGTFSIDVSADNKILVFELKDYETQEVPINGKKEYDIILRQKGSSSKILNNQSNKNVYVKPVSEAFLYTVNIKKIFSLKNYEEGLQ